MNKLLKTIVLTLFLAATAFCADSAKGIDVAYYSKLRFDYAAQKDYSPGWDRDDARDAVFEAFKKGDYDKTKELGDAWLAKTPIDAEVYLVVSYSLKAKGDLQHFCLYMAHHYGLLSSITSTGDGLTAETAFKVISVSEEYFLLREIGAKLKHQSLVGNCDVMVVDLRGKEMTFYFDVSISLGAQRRELGIK